jgi:hypothetical protein
MLNGGIQRRDCASTLNDRARRLLDSSFRAVDRYLIAIGFTAEPHP